LGARPGSEEVSRGKKSVKDRRFQKKERKESGKWRGFKQDKKLLSENALELNLQILFPTWDIFSTKS
jgi:hypothetical protein